MEKMKKTERLTLGIALRDERYKKQYNQSFLAEKAGLSNNYIGDIENGRKQISLCAFLKICEALEIEPEFILKTYYQKRG